MSDLCPTCDNKYVNLPSHLSNFPEHKPDPWPNCPECGERFKQLGYHWSQSNCGYPKLSDQQESIIRGVLMGDGYMSGGSTENSNPYLVVSMTNNEYLEYLKGALNPFIASLSMKLTGEENAQEKRDSGFRPNAEEDNYSDIYWLQSRSHPDLQKYRNWYSSGKKVFPSDLDFNETVLKHWFVCDGSYDGSRAEIALSNESGNEEKIASYFDQIDMPEPNWSYRTNSEGTEVVTIYYNKFWTGKFFDRIGDPVEGFKYKWPEDRV